MKEAEDDEVVEEEDVLPLKAPSKKVSQAKKKKQAQSKQAWIGESVKVCSPPTPCPGLPQGHHGQCSECQDSCDLFLF